MPPEIEGIDEELNALLRRRIAALATRIRGESGAPGELGPVPGYVLRSIDEVTLAAASAAARRRHVEARPRTVVVIGRRGATGAFFAGRMEAFGHSVAGFGRAGWGGQAESMLPSADLVLVSVPPEQVCGVVRRASAHMRPDAVLADVTSVKLPAFSAMMEAHPGPVVGLHPMFGPGVDSFLSQTVVVCHGRGEDAYRWLLELIEADGARLAVSSPEEHDATMVTVQAIRHFATMCLGAFLAGEGIDLTGSLSFASPVYRLEIDFVGRLFAQDAGLYAEIMLASPERKAAAGRLAETFAELAELVRRGDRDGLVALFERVRSALGAETSRALAESSRIIEAFGTMLAAHEARQAIAGGDAARQQRSDAGHVALRRGATNGG